MCDGAACVDNQQALRHHTEYSLRNPCLGLNYYAAVSSDACLSANLTPVTSVIV